MEFLVPKPLGVALFAVVTLVSTSVTAAPTKTSCEFTQVTFATDFPTGRLSRCEQTGPESFRLHLHPEDKKINPSPWYAFRVIPKSPEIVKRDLSITLVAHGGPARYTPKISHDKKTWRSIPFKKNDNRMQFEIQLSDHQELYVAGQEIVDNQMYKTWLQQISQQHDNSKVFQLGTSHEGRPMWALEYRAGERKPWLVIIGRQHPPEVTGALALMHFTEALLANGKAFNDFRQHYNLLVVPNMNPDGVYRGNWRHTSNGVDLNRDWRQRKEPESQQLHNYLQHLASRGESIEFALDFHSTHHNIYYTIPATYQPQNGQPLARPNAVNHWLEKLADNIPWKVTQKPGHNPNSGVFKQYIADHYAVHGVTYEVGDNTKRGEIKQTAQIAAQQLVEVLLTPKLRAPKRD